MVCRVLGYLNIEKEISAKRNIVLDFVEVWICFNHLSFIGMHFTSTTAYVL